MACAVGGGPGAVAATVSGNGAAAAGAAQRVVEPTAGGWQRSHMPAVWGASSTACAAVEGQQHNFQLCT